MSLKGSPKPHEKRTTFSFFGWADDSSPSLKGAERATHATTGQHTNTNRIADETSDADESCAMIEVRSNYFVHDAQATIPITSPCLSRPNHAIVNAVGKMCLDASRCVVHLCDL